MISMRTRRINVSQRLTAITEDVAIAHDQDLCARFVDVFDRPHEVVQCGQSDHLASIGKSLPTLSGFEDLQGKAGSTSSIFAFRLV